MDLINPSSSFKKYIRSFLNRIKMRFIIRHSTIRIETSVTDRQTDSQTDKLKDLLELHSAAGNVLLHIRLSNYRIELCLL